MAAPIQVHYSAVVAAAAAAAAALLLLRNPLAANAVRHKSNGYVVSVAPSPAVAPLANATAVLLDAIPLRVCRIGAGMRGNGDLLQDV